MKIGQRASPVRITSGGIPLGFQTFDGLTVEILCIHSVPLTAQDERQCLEILTIIQQRFDTAQRVVDRSGCVTGFGVLR